MRIHPKLEKCPQCKWPLHYTQTYGSEILKGSPVRVCPYCNATFFDPDYKEWGLILFADKGDTFSIWEIIGLLMTHAALIFDFCSPAQYNFSIKALLAVGGTFIIAVLLDCSLFRAIKNRIHSEEYHQKQIDYIEGRGKKRPTELVESMERLSNKEYLDSLKEHGIEVPDYFYERLYNMHGKIE